MYQDFARLYDELMNEVNYQQWADYLIGIFERYHMPEDAAIVDCACGTGNIALELAKRDYDVTGLDISQDMLRVAMQKNRESMLDIHFVQQDMREIRLHKCVDIINSACDGVNYLLDQQAVMKFLRSAYAGLKKGGLLCFDISSKYKLEQILGCNTFAQDGENAAYIWENMYDDQSELIEMQLVFFAKSGDSYKKFCETHLQRAHETQYLIDALENAGFCEISCFQAFSFEEPRPDSERIQFAARKPD